MLSRISKEAESGIALVTVLMVLLLLTVLVTSGVYLMVSESAQSGNYLTTNRAYYVAEAGIQRSIDWFSHQYSPTNYTLYNNGSTYPVLITVGGSNVPITLIYNVSGTTATYPDTTQSTNFSAFLAATDNIQLPLTGGSALTGKYTVTARLLSTKPISSFLGGSNGNAVERWRIEVTGTVNQGNAILSSSQVNAIIETYTQPFFSKAICGSSIVINSPGLTNSYDSSTGSYSTSNSNGSIGTYGPCSGCKITASGLQIYGELDLGSLSQGSCSAGTNSSLGCSSTNYCNPLPAIPSFTVSSNSNNSPNGCTSTTGPCVPSPATTPEHGSCPTTSCNPRLLEWYASSSSSYSTAADGAKFSTGSEENLTIGVPSGTTGDVYFWFNQITINSTGPSSGPLQNVPVLFDNKTGRTGNGKMVIYTDQFTMSSGSLKINSDNNNPVYLYVQSRFAQNGGTYSNSPLNDGGFFIIYTGSQQASVTGGSGAGMVLLSTDPSATVAINGGSQIYGAIEAAGPVVMSSGSPTTAVHFDTALQKNIVTTYNFLPNTEVRRVE